jgi:hypothetical protein
MVALCSQASLLLQGCLADGNYFHHLSFLLVGLRWVLGLAATGFCQLDRNDKYWSEFQCRKPMVLAKPEPSIQISWTSYWRVLQGLNIDAFGR